MLRAVGRHGALICRSSAVSRGMLCSPNGLCSPSRVPPRRLTFVVDVLSCSQGMSTTSLIPSDVGAPTPSQLGTAPSRVPGRNTLVSTLDPSKVTMQDIVDLSGIKRKVVHLTRFRSKPDTFSVTYKGLDLKLQPFPPNTSGVFYFHDRTSIHPVAGELRFRVFPMDTIRDSESINVAELFAKGYDLLDYYGLKPWGLSLLSIISKNRVGLYTYMRKEGLITDEADLQVQRMKLSAKIGDGLGQVLEQVTSPFILDLSKDNEPMMILHEDGISPFRLRTLQMTVKKPKPSSYLVRSPCYSGTVLARFEMIRHEERNRVVLRVLKFLRPPNPSDAVVQKEGELLKRYDRENATEVVWMAGKDSELLKPSFQPVLEQLEKTYIASKSR